MTRLAQRPLSVVGAPSAAGSYGPGQERTPARLREHGLLDALAPAADRGDIPGAPFADDPDHPTAQNAAQVARVCRDLSTSVASALGAGEDLLVVGGDCTVCLGAVAGALQVGSVGLVYVDLDTDLNTPETADAGRLDWMGVAHMLDVDGSNAEVAGFAGRRPLLAPDAVRLFGAGNVTAAESATIERLELRLETVPAIREDLASVLQRTEEWSAGFDLLLVHVDVDVLDFDDFPIAENDRRDVGGLMADELEALMSGLVAMPGFRLLTLSEVNLDHAPDPAAAARRLIDILARVFSC